MKKEFGVIFQDIEKKYNLNDYKKTEYLKRMIKELAKFDKKLVKIENYEKMEKEGKILNDEMRELISKKKGFEKHIESLKIALNIYQQTLDVEDEPQAKTPLIDFQKDIKVEVDKQVKEFTGEVVTKLSYVFAFGRTLSEKNNLIVNPFAEMPEEKRKLISEIYNAFTSLPRDKETSLAEEARKTANAIKKLLKPNDPSNFITGLAGENELMQKKFTFPYPRENEYTIIQSVSILKDEVKEKQPEPVLEEISKVQEEPITESSKPTNKEIHQEPEKEKEVQDTWAEREIDSEKEEHQEEEEQNVKEEDGFEFPKQEEEEEEFETVLSKHQARRARGEERGTRRGKFGGKKFRGNKEEGYRRSEGQKKKDEEHKKGYKKESEYKKESHNEAHWGEEGGNYRGGYKGGYQPRRRGYYRGRRGDYGEDHRGGRRYIQSRSTYQQQ